MSEVTELLVRLIRNGCVNDGSPDSGQEWRSVETLTDYLGRAPDLLVEPHSGRQSALWRLGGRPGAPRLMLMTHLDVVPADPEGWSVDPFAGEVRDGIVWGRGAVDMLNMAAAMASVFRAVADGALAPPPGDLALLAVADEEAGGGLGAGYLTEHHWEAVACEYLLTEVGHPTFRTPKGGVQPITVAEKGPMWRRLHMRGAPGHGSQPYGTRNAITDLARLITDLTSGPSPVLISDEWRGFAHTIGRPELADPGRLEEAIEELAVESPALARWVHAVTHLTISPNLVSGGVKANVVAEHAQADLDVRALPGQDGPVIDDHIHEAAGALTERLRIEPVLEFPASASRPEGPFWEAIEGAFRDLAGMDHLTPVPIPVATDARFFRARGTTAYGIGWYDEGTDFAEFLQMFHGRDERVSQASLDRTARLIGRVIEELGRGTVNRRS